MSRISKVLKYGAFAMMALFGLLGGAFVIGEAFAEPGGWTAVWISALWVVPLVALSAFVLMRPAAATPVAVGATVVVGLFTLADSVFGIVARDSWGPVAAIAVFALGVVLAFFGLHRAGLAGGLMIAIGLVQLGATVLGRESGGGPGLRDMLGGSSGAVVVPIILMGTLFLLSSAFTREAGHPQTPQQSPRTRPAG